MRHTTKPKSKAMTRAEAIAEWKATKKLNTLMLTPLEISFERFLWLGQLSDEKVVNIIDKLVEHFEQEK